MNEPDEVIPPFSSRRGVRVPSGRTDEERHAMARIAARWLDELFPIPGTRFRIGLDPIISLIPGVGDVISSSISFVVILEAMRIGVSYSVILHMAFNMAVNALLDMIPGAGQVASVFFHSNSMNLRLLHRWQNEPHKHVRRGSRLMLLGIVSVCFLLLLALVAVWTFYVWTAAKVLGLR